jgi:transposase InsO family protein
MIREHQHTVGIRPLCEALGEPRSTWYRFQKPRSTVSKERRSPRRLTRTEERQVLDTLNSARFRDMAPAEVHATLLDEGVYHCSVRTMYRILSQENQAVIRRQSAPRAYAKPELLATAPNQVWSWVITKLRGPVKWTFFYLYKVLDIYSRYAVGWMVATRESADLAKALFAETCQKQGVERDTLTIHSDNGSPMKAHSFAQLLADLGVTTSYSRPSVSNDNPFSESAFKTLKYRPGYPDRFGSLEDARSFCREFFAWYNTEHRHSGIAMLTPENIHYNTHQEIIQSRAETLEAFYQKHPERFVKGVPKVREVPKEVWINNPHSKEMNQSGMKRDHLRDHALENPASKTTEGVS